MPSEDASSTDGASVGPASLAVHCGITNAAPRRCAVPDNLCCASNTASGTSYACLPSGTECNGIPVACDSAAECPAGQVCCGYFQNSSTTSPGPYYRVVCTANCVNSNGLEAIRFCDKNAPVSECESTKTCVPSSIWPDYTVCRTTN